MAPVDLTQQPIWLRVVIILCCSFLQTAWCRAVVSRSKDTWMRLGLVMPVIAVNAWLPTMFIPGPEVVFRGSVSFLFSWLSSFKALAFALHRGPLVNPSLGFLQFFFLQHMPVLPLPTSDDPAKKPKYKDAGSPAALLGRGILKCVLLQGLVHFLTSGVHIPKVVEHHLWAFGLYFFLGIILDLPASLISSLLSLKIIPTASEPWMSRSLQDFWGRRWNIGTAGTLKMLVYDPIFEESLAALPSTTKTQKTHKLPLAWRRALGVLATFAVSGIMHEFLLWRMGYWPPQIHWKWMTFFLLQGPIMILEQYGLKYMHQHNVWVPNVLRIAVTVTVLQAVAYNYFFQPVEDSNLVYDMIDAFKYDFSKLMP